MVQDEKNRQIEQTYVARGEESGLSLNVIKPGLVVVSKKHVASELRRSMAKTLNNARVQISGYNAE